VERGYDGLTVDGVARRAGVYRRWGDVAGLLAGLLDAATDDGWEPPDTGSFDNDLAALVREVHDGFAGTGQAPLTAAVIAVSFRSPHVATALRRFWLDRYSRSVAVVHRAVARGELPADVDAQRLLIAATAPAYHHLVLLRDRPTVDELESYAHTVAVAARTGAFLRRN